MANYMGKRVNLIRSFSYLQGEGLVEIVRSEFNANKSPPGYENNKLHLDPLNVRAEGDFKNLRIAYFGFFKGLGIDMRHPIAPGEPQKAPWPKKIITPDGVEHRYSRGCRFLLKLDGEDEARDWVVTGDDVWDQVAELHGNYIDHRKEHPGQLPVFSFIKLKPMANRAGTGTIYVPMLGTVGWQARSSCLPDVPAVKEPLSDAAIDAFRRGKLEEFKKRDDDDGGGGDYGGGNGGGPPDDGAAPADYNGPADDDEMVPF